VARITRWLQAMGGERRDIPLTGRRCRRERVSKCRLDWTYWARTPSEATHLCLARRLRSSGMTDAFISYAREERVFVQRLQHALAERTPPKHIWIDLEDIPPAAQWRREVQEGIDASESFLFVISPEAIGSVECQKELEHAMLASKRCIPILRREPPQDLNFAAALRDLNWIPFTDADDFERSLERLVTALETDLEWVRVHTWLHRHAMEWHTKGHTDAALLRAGELQSALKWQAIGNLGKKPPLAQLHAEYIDASQAHEAAEIERWKTLYATALSRQIATQAQHAEGATALLLATEAMRANDGYESRRVLLDVDRRFSHTRCLFHGHAGSVMQLAFNAAGTILASASWDRTIRLWDLETRRQIGNALLGHREPVAAIAFDPVSGRLVSAGYDGSLISWDVASGQNDVLATSEYRLLCLAFSPDGGLCATGTREGSVLLWHVDSERRFRPLKELFAHSRMVSGLTFGPDGTLVSGGEAGEIVYWDLRASKPETAFRTEAGVTAVAISSRNVLAWSDLNGTVTAVNRKSDPHTAASLYRHGGPARSVAFSSNGLWLASCGDDRAIVWDIEHRSARLDVVVGHSKSLLCVCFSNDDRTLASGGWDKTVALWSLEPQNETALSTDMDSITGLHYCDGGDAIVSACLPRNTITLWDVGTQRARASFEGAAVACGPAGKRFALRRSDGTIQVREFATGDEVVSVPRGASPDPNDVEIFALSADGTRLAVYTPRHGLTLWNVERQTSRTISLTHAGELTALLFNGDGSVLVTGGSDGSVRRWSCDTLEPIGEALAGHRVSITAIACSLDGERLATGDRDDSIRIWQLATGTSVKLDGHIGVDTKQHYGEATLAALLNGFGRAVVSLSFAPDSRMLASAGGKGTICLWHTESGRPLVRPWLAHSLGTCCVAFSPDGLTLASSGGDDKISLWSVGPQAILARIAPLANRNLSRDEWQSFIGDVPYRCTIPELPEPELIP
jgi:WD40 repeat protein